MPYKKFTIGLVIIGALVLGIAGYFFYLTFSPTQDTEQQEEGTGLFPGDTQPPQEPTTTTSSVDTSDTTDTTPATQTAGLPKVRQLATFPVSGLSADYKEITKQVTQKITTNSTVSSTGTNSTTSTITAQQLKARFPKKTNGYIYSRRVDQKDIPKQITKTITPESKEAYMLENGAVYRYFNKANKTIETLIGINNENKIPDDVCNTPIESSTEDKPSKKVTKELQKFLAYKITDEIAVDGVWGSATEEALKTFQTNNEINPSGNLTQPTIRVIKSQCGELIEKRKQQQNSPAELDGTFLPTNILTLGKHPATSSLFYMHPTTSNGSQLFTGVLYDAKKQEKTQIWETRFSEWLATWVTDETISLQTKASGLAAGYLYTLNTNTGSIKKVLGGINGLTTKMNPDGTKVLVSSTSERTIDPVRIYNTETNKFNKTSVTTLAEKCAWQNDTIVYCGVPDFVQSNTYPDAWYKQKIYFNDNLWRINTETGKESLVVNLVNEASNSDRDSFDISEPFVGSKGAYLFFIEKESKTPWVIEL